MLDFAFEPWIVGDTSTLGLVEEIQEQKVNAAIDWIKKNLTEPIPISQMDMQWKILISTMTNCRIG